MSKKVNIAALNALDEVRYWKSKLKKQQLVGVWDSNLRGIEMEEVGRDKQYIFWQGEDDNGKQVYNITPIGSYKPYGGYYNAAYILGMKQLQISLFKQK